MPPTLSPILNSFLSEAFGPVKSSCVQLHSFSKNRIGRTLGNNSANWLMRTGYRRSPLERRLTIEQHEVGVTEASCFSLDEQVVLFELGHRHLSKLVLVGLIRVDLGCEHSCWELGHVGLLILLCNFLK